MTPINQNAKSLIIKEVGFKLLELKFKNNKVLKDLEINFTNLKEIINRKLYTSVIIGPNGTGKSYILRALEDIFSEISSVKRTGKRNYQMTGAFSIKYIIDSEIYEFGTINLELNDSKNKSKEYVRFWLIKNDVKVQSDLIQEELKGPNSLIASCIMLTDKFRIVSKTTFPEFKYLGVRKEATPSNAGTRTYVERTVECVMNSVKNKEFIKKLKKVVTFLDLSPSFFISFSPRYKPKIFNGNLSIRFFEDFFEKYWVHTRRREGKPSWSKRYYDNNIKNNHTLKTKLVNLCNSISSRLENYPDSKSLYFGYEIISENNFAEEFNLIQELRSLDLLTYPTISLKKLDEEFDLDESSSGEAHFLSSLISIIATVEKNSLILIDEPEISLHPNWQMRYMDFLNKIFIDTSSLHFVIATHSHFLISDLEGKNSKIIPLQRNKNNIDVLDLSDNINTYGWSAEQVLLDVFQVPTTRNYYIADKLGEILNLIGKPERNMADIQTKVRELRDKNILNLSEEDPLKNVIIKLIEKYA